MDIIHTASRQRSPIRKWPVNEKRNAPGLGPNVDSERAPSENRVVDSNIASRMVLTNSLAPRAFEHTAGSFGRWSAGEWNHNVVPNVRNAHLRPGALPRPRGTASGCIQISECRLCFPSAPPKHGPGRVGH